VTGWHLSSVTVTFVNAVSVDKFWTEYEYVILLPGVTVVGFTLVVRPSCGDLAYAHVPALASTRTGVSRFVSGGRGADGSANAACKRLYDTSAPNPTRVPALAAMALDFFIKHLL
jgi:hypothetical protein